MSSPSQSLLKPNQNPLLGSALSSKPWSPSRRRASFTTRAILSNSRELALKGFHERRALKIISGLQNFDRENVSSVVTAADKGGATHVDIACDPDLVRLAIALTSLLVEIGNYDSFYEMGVVFSPDQVKLAELLEQEGADIIQTEGGKCSNPSASGVLGLIEKAMPTLAAAYSISRAVKIPMMCSSGLSAVTAPMAITAGAAGVGVGSAINKLNDVVAMIAEVKNIADSLKLPSQRDVRKERSLNL
ncbi:hypothetical protein NL676_012598 [Syzygium grande]|nr:hypothetical protein NL676_012598 [Syzygium grande]